jgi:hypothetical protein
MLHDCVSRQWLRVHPMPFAARYPGTVTDSSSLSTVSSLELGSDLFVRWREAGSVAELHIYSKGRHGFGTTRQGLPIDHWMDAFYAWLAQQGFTGKPAHRHAAGYAGAVVGAGGRLYGSAHLTAMFVGGIARI